MSSPITSYLSKLEPRFKDQNVSYGLRNTVRCLSAPTTQFFGPKLKKKSLKLSFFFSVFYGSNDTIDVIKSH